MTLQRFIPAMICASAIVSAPHVLAQTPQPQMSQPMANPIEAMMGDDYRGLADNAKFAQKANVSGTFEVLSSRLALARSKNPDVRAFAEKMIADHTTASAALNQAVRTDRLEAHPPLLDQKHRSMFDRLKDASDDDFDKMYIDMQTSAHDEAVKLFRDYSNNGPAGALKDFATKTLPTLNAHHEHIKTIDKRH